MDNLSSDRVRDDIFCHHHFLFVSNSAQVEDAKKSSEKHA